MDVARDFMKLMGASMRWRIGLNQLPPSGNAPRSVHEEPPSGRFPENFFTMLRRCRAAPAAIPLIATTVDAVRSNSKAIRFILRAPAPPTHSRQAPVLDLYDPRGRNGS